MNQDTFYPNDTSYTNKDFRAIYEELLSTATKLSERWNPEQSNESDPGVVLIKLMAVLGDKLNYNIDKNILELFPDSVTQWGNAQKIYNLIAYNMKWYRSATMDINVLWVGEKDETSSIIIPEFTQFTNTEENLVYTLIGKLSIPKNGTVISTNMENGFGYLIEGTINDLTINNNEQNTVISLDNIDSDNRVYFRESNIAQNGIYVKNADEIEWGFDTNVWQRVDNVDTTELGSKVFSFGVLPNSNTCYIQFPQDIAKLIGSGLNIKYIISKGAQGSANSNTIVKLFADILDDENLPINDSLKIYNTYPSTNGYNPETIEEAYRGYKRVIGTFDTLVTTRDYENAIYNGIEPNKQNTVSNVVVADRTNDHSTQYICTLTSSGEQRELQSGEMTAFDLAIYPLNPIGKIYVTTDAKSRTLAKNRFDDSFKTNGSTFTNAESVIEDNKSISHNIIQPTEETPYIYKCYFDVVGKVTTYNKVSKQEVAEIEANIQQALYNSLQSRNLDFGAALTSDELVSIIENADSRIRNVLIGDIEYDKVTLMTNDNTEENVDKTALQAKGVLGGVTPAFDFDTSFDYEFGQTNTSVISDVSSLTTETEINLTANTDFTVLPNEFVVAFTPNYVTKTQYSNYLYYRCNIDNTLNIKSGDYHKLKDGEYIYLSATKDGVDEPTVREYTIRAGMVISPNGFTLKNNVGEANPSMLSTNQSISVLEPNVVKLDSNMKCYWLMNNIDNVLFDVNSTEVLLGNGEYFLYLDETQTQLTIVSSGTTIRRSGDTSQWKVEREDIDVSADVSSEITSIDWFVLPLNTAVTIVENEINIYSDCTISCSSELSITNTAQSLTNYSDFKVDGRSALSSRPGGWQIFSQLSISGSPSKPMDFEEDRWKIIINGDDTNSITGAPNKKLLFNSIIAIQGGGNQDVRAITEDGTLEPISIYAYIQGNKVVRQDDYVELDTTATLNFDFKQGANYVIPIIYTANGDAALTITNGTRLGNSNTEITNREQSYSILVKGAEATNSITFTIVNGVSAKVLVGKIYKITADHIGATTQTAGEIYTKIKSIDTNGVFDYTKQPSDDEKISVDTIYSPSAFFNPYHPLNRFVIAKLNSINVTIAESSKSK